jgi:response regulator RpfG family c-di-GMP phosphodiesterase
MPLTNKYSPSNPEASDDNSIDHPHLAIIRHLGELVFFGAPADELLQQTLEATLTLFDAKAASFQIYEANSKELVFSKVATERDTSLIGRSVSIESGINGKVFRTGIAEASSKVHDCPEWNSFVDRTSGYCTESMLTAPVKRPNGNSLGIIQVLNGRYDFKEKHLSILEILCLYVSQSIENDRLRQLNEERSNQLKNLREFELAVESSTEPLSTMENITGQVIKMLEVDAVRIWLYDPPSEMPHSVSSRGLFNKTIFLDSMPVGESYIGRLANESLTAPQNQTPRLSVEDLSAETTELKVVGPLRAEGFISYHAVPLFFDSEFKGIIDVYNRKHMVCGEEWFQFFELLALLSASVITKANLISSLKTSNLQLVSSFDDTLSGLAALLDLRAREPKGHAERVSQAMLSLAREMGVPEESLVHMWRGAMVHDLGKIAVPDSILLKTGPLNEEDWRVMKNHPIHILETLWPIEYLRPALDIPCYHHERWNGSGYPHGLVGEQIPLAARIFAVIEAWDIMRCDRPFRAGWQEDKVRAYIAKQSGSAYDPNVVDAFQRLKI